MGYYLGAIGHNDILYDAVNWQNIAGVVGFLALIGFLCWRITPKPPVPMRRDEHLEQESGSVLNDE